ncbi:hypothetical protein LIER_07870 [Lithospermum erythrorhizon]|uniref:Uncharacterized protein n=1 Tax=Lithospermum erythrorhizon TaxID=34254 RepID=A0AAV3PBU1_LITER
MGLGDFPDLHDKLQGFFQQEERQIRRRQLLPRKAEVLEQEAAELEACEWDLHTRAQEQRSVVTQQDLEEPGTSQ